MAINAVKKTIDRPARLQSRSRAGLYRFLLIGWIVSAGVFVTCAEAGKISLRIGGSVAFADASPDAVPVLGPQSITLEIKAVGRRGIPWSLTLIANSDFQSVSDFIPITVVSWTAFPSPPYASGTLSTVVPRLIAGGQTHELDVVTFDFFMQNSWAYNAGDYSSTATFTLAAP